MATIIQTIRKPKSTNRFHLITTHYQTIFLRDEFTEKEFTIECVNRKEMHKMCCWEDSQWIQWLDSNGAYK